VLYISLQTTAAANCCGRSVFIYGSFVFLHLLKPLNICHEPFWRGSPSGGVSPGCCPGCPPCPHFPQVKSREKHPKKCPYCVTGAQKGEFMRTGLTKQEKTTDIWFDEKDPLIHIRTHNTALKKRLLAYSRRYPAICRQTDTDPDTGCMEFDIAKGRFSFRLTAPYSEKRRRAASGAAKAHTDNLSRTIQKDVV